MSSPISHLNSILPPVSYTGRPEQMTVAQDANVAPAPSPAPDANKPTLPISVDTDGMHASMTYDQQLKAIVITLQSNDTGEVIQQIPSRQVLNMLQGFMDTLGKMLDAHG